VASRGAAGYGKPSAMPDLVLWRSTRSRKALIVLGLLLLLVVLHGAVWFWGEARLRAGVDAWVAQQRHAGWDIDAGKPVRAGWPMAVALTYPDLRVAGPLPRLSLRGDWYAERLTLRMDPLRPHEMQIAAMGRQTLRLDGLTALRFSAERLLMTVPLTVSAPSGEVTLQARKLRAAMEGGTGNVTIDGLDGSLDAAPDPSPGDSTLEFHATTTGIGLPNGRDWPLGPAISSLVLDASLHGEVPLEGSLPDRLAVWRERGGTVGVQRFAMDWGPAHAEASATITLDEQLQPVGAATVRVTGWEAAADSLSRSGGIVPNAGPVVRAMLGLLARQPENGGPSEVELPVTLQGSVVSVGHIPLLRVPTVNWPAE
jgi:hypothetical protein